MALLTVPLVQGERQVLPDQRAVLARGPPGDPPIHHIHHLFAVSPATPANRLQDDPAEGSQTIHVAFASRPVQQLELATQLGEEGVLATKGNHSQDRQRLGDQLPPEFVWNWVLGEARAGWRWVLVCSPGSPCTLTALLTLAAPWHQKATVPADCALDGVQPDGDDRGVGTLLQVRPFHVGGAAQLRGPLGTGAAKRTGPWRGTQG